MVCDETRGARSGARLRAAASGRTFPTTTGPARSIDAGVSAVHQAMGGRARPMSEEFAVRFEKINKSYDGRTLVVRDLDLDVRRGEFLTLLGPSGSGKTTCLHDARGVRSADLRRDPHPRQAGDVAAAAPARHRHGVPELRAVSAPERRRQHRVSALRAQTCRAPRSNERVARALDMVQLSGLRRTAGRASCPAASSSASRSRARSCSSRS